MDPNTTLQHLRDLIRQLRQATTTQAQADLGEQLADALEDLDDWLHRGGLLPRRWQR